MNERVDVGDWPSHLGGYVPGGDPYSACPRLWAWLHDAYDVRSVIDVGCGDGGALDAFTKLGLDAFGVEGTPQAHPRIVLHDYTAGPYRPSREFDLAWSIEFVEHVEAEYVPNFLATFEAAPLVLMSHAVPGQPGYHHVNCQHVDYWIEQMGAVGYLFDPALTDAARALCAEQGNHFARTGLAFRRETKLEKGTSNGRIRKG